MLLLANHRFFFFNEFIVELVTCADMMALLGASFLAIHPLGPYYVQSIGAA